MKLLAFAASNSKQSINRQLIGYASRLLSDGSIKGVDSDNLTIDEINIDNYEMPIYSPRREDKDGVPDLAQTFFDKIGNSDALLISFAEHNGLYTAAYKNLFDWASRIEKEIYQDKRTVMLATSPGSRGGRSVLATAVDSAPSFGAEVVASLSVPSFDDNFDVASRSLCNDELDLKLREGLALLCGQTYAPQS